MPVSRKSKAAAAAEEQTLLAIEVDATAEATTIETIAVETVSTETVSTETALAAINPLPALDAAAVSTNEPAISYKIDFSDEQHWYSSTDGGKSKQCTNSGAVAGCPIDLALQISKAKWGDGFDQRLRLAFMQPDGVMAELNLTAVNSTKSGELYVTSPVRSLVGALLAISESEDDICAFCEGARFRIKPGRGKGLFIETDLACRGQWIAMGGPAATNQVAKDPAGLHAQLTVIKQRFRAAGQLLSAAAVTGDIAGYDSSLRLLESAADEA